jgi:alkanesulfonate monooxygenase
MSNLRFGIHLPNGGFEDLPFSHIKKLAVEAEKLGYDSLWVSDHLVYPESLGPPNIYEPLTTLAALSSITNRISLGTSVLLPLRHPVIAASMISTLDHASGGRVIVGMGAGWYKDEFDACGVPYNERGKIEEEQIMLLRLLWSTTNVNFQGRHFEARNLTVNPKPLQKPHPRIWLGGSARETFERIAKHGDGWLAWGPTPETWLRGISEIRAFCRAEGRDPSRLEFAVDFPTCIREDYDAAKKEAKRMNLEEQGTIVGSPKECMEHLSQYVARGLGNIIFYLGARGQELESMRLISRHVIPSI